MIIISNESGIYCTKELTIKDYDGGGFGLCLDGGEEIFYSRSKKDCVNMLIKIQKHIEKYPLKDGVCFSYKIFKMPEFK